MILGELLPACQAPNTEKQILGAILMAFQANASEAAPGLAVPPEDYAFEKHATIAKAMQALDEAKKPVDFFTLEAQLKQMGKGEPQLLDYILEISGEVFTTTSLAAHAAYIRELARRRRFIVGTLNVLEQAGNIEKPFPEVEAAAEAVLMGAHEEKPQEGLIPMRTVVKRGTEEFMSRMRGEVAGVMTGLHDVDKILLGLRPSQVTILAARPAMGKSALALQVAKHVAATTRKAVPMFTLEMLAQEQLERLLAQEDGRLDSYALSDKFALDRYASLITALMGEMADLPIWMNESSNITPPEMLRQCRELHRKHPGGIGLLVVDYLQLVEAHGKHETREREVNYVSKYLKRIANDLRIPVLAVASLSRSCDMREDKRPLLADLRESGQIESDAHKVLFLYRDEIYKACDENKGVAELLVRKNKGGKTGMIPITFRDSETRFYDMQKEAKEAYAEFLAGKSERKASGKDPGPQEPPQRRWQGGGGRDHQTPPGDNW